MKQCVRYALILFVITAACAGILGAINQITEPVIAVNDRKTEEESMKKLLPESTGFEKLPEVKTGDIESVYMGQKSQEITGYVVKIGKEGYGGRISMLVGLDNENVITGISLISHLETPGFGANADKEIFKAQYKGKITPLKVSQNACLDNEIQGLTGATITSTAITEGVNEAAAFVAENKQKWGK